MKSRAALKALAEVTESQWGMVTSAQAIARGVSHLNLSRLTESGDLVRLAHGVYKDGGAPSDEHKALRAAWLAVEPERPAWERVKDRPGFATVSGESAAGLHGIGNLRAMRSEFTTPVRKQTQRRDVRYRMRTLPSDDVTIRNGLPVTTPERTIADLIEDRAQFDHVADALRDAVRKSRLDMDRLSELLAPLAERNGHRKGDGDSLLGQLLETAQIDTESLSKQLASIPDLGALVTRDYLASNDVSALFDTRAMRSVLDAQAKHFAGIADALSKVVMPTLPVLDKLAESIRAATAAFDTPALRSLLRSQEEQIAAMSGAVSKLAVPETLALDTIKAALGHMSVTGAHRHVAEALGAADWASLAQTTEDRSADGEN